MRKRHKWHHLPEGWFSLTMPAGRPSSYSLKRAADICVGISRGKMLAQVCAKKGMPTVATVYIWLSKHPEFVELYTRAKEIQVDVIASETLTISDKTKRGVKTEEKHVGWRCQKCGKDVAWRGVGWVHSGDGSVICAGVDKPERITETKTVTGDQVDRARLMVDTRKWLLSKIAPRKYGERIELAGDSAGGPAIRLIVSPAGARDRDK